MSLFPSASTGATLSPCQTWRYALWRRWGPGPLVAFVGLNPSTADETADDPTIRRCIGFARDTGHGGLYMLNLFALRSTDPRGLLTAPDPVGPENDANIAMRLADVDLAIAAWGAWPGTEARALVVSRLAAAAGKPLHALATTKAGHPAHPLYLPATCRPNLWTTP